MRRFLSQHAASLRAQAQALLVQAAALEALGTGEPDANDDPFVRVTDRTRGVLPARVVNSACAAGQIKTAAKPGKSWIARRSAIDSWLASERTSPANDSDSLAASWEARSAGGAR